MASWVKGSSWLSLPPLLRIKNSEYSTGIFFLMGTYVLSGVYVCHVVVSCRGHFPECTECIFSFSSKSRLSAEEPHIRCSIVPLLQALCGQDSRGAVPVCWWCRSLVSGRLWGQQWVATCQEQAHSLWVQGCRIQTLLLSVSSDSISGTADPEHQRGPKSPEDPVSSFHRWGNPCLEERNNEQRELCRTDGATLFISDIEPQAQSTPLNLWKLCGMSPTTMLDIPKYLSWPWLMGMHSSHSTFPGLREPSEEG